MCPHTLCSLRIALHLLVNRLIDANCCWFLQFRPSKSFKSYPVGPFHSPPSRANECKGTKEEFVQLMKKSLMAEQLFAEGVGPSQKIDDIPIAGVQAAWHTRKKMRAGSH